MMEQEYGNSIPRMRTIKEVSATTGISYDAIRKMCLRKEIPHIRCGKKFLVNLDQFIDYLNQGHISEQRMEEEKSNQRIRNAMADSGMYYWELADRLGVTPWTLTVWMRHEMPEEKQERILQLIREESEQMRKEEAGMTDMDNLRELSSADVDPQFQDPDAYDKDEWLDRLAEAEDHIDDAIRTLEEANQEHEVEGIDRIIKCLKEASSRLEDSR